jgi:UDP-N-acetylmuramoyl-L-alanyl-D-glutamate--2,6-diaminopimelate ligase
MIQFISTSHNNYLLNFTIEIMKKYVSKFLPQALKNEYHKIRAKRAVIKYGDPSSKLKIIGITGTDGKTSTSTMLYEILKAGGKKVGLITTISAKIGDNEYPTGFHVTSPDPEDLQKFLKDMVDAGLEYVVLETTSHGLYQNRVYGIDYLAALYTNITHEHLDHHKTYAKYVKAKAKLMKQTNVENGFAVINRDDQSYDLLQKEALKLGLKTFTYGLSEKSDIYATNINEEIDKTDFIASFRGSEYNMSMHLPGRYNIYNSLAAIMAALRIDLKAKDISKGLQEIKGIEGRWEIIQNEPYKVIVDFAHTPNSLYNVLKFAQEDNGKGRVIVVFGSAGKRDRSKRPLMGKAAATFADTIILTAEDPRGESVTKISKEIATGFAGLSKVENTDYFILEDRRKAIELAIKLAKPSDTVLITGKGHEGSLNLDGITEIPWSDPRVTEELLNSQNHQES